MTRARWFAVSVVALLAVAAAACSVLTSFDGYAGSEAAAAEGGSGADGALADGGCMDGAPGCGAVVTCDADLTTSENCGACGHDCFGGPCSAGKCGAVPIASGIKDIGFVEVNGASLAVSSGGDGGTSGGVYAMQIDGGDLRVLASGQNGPNYGASDRDHLYFTTFFGGQIESVQWDGGALSTLAQRAKVNGVQTTGLDVIWAEQGDGGENGGLYRVDFAGTTVTPIITGQVGPECVALIDGGFVFSDFDYHGKSIIVVDELGSATTIAMGSNPACVDADGVAAYWSDSIANTIKRTTLGSNVTVELAATGMTPGFVRIDATYVYWTESNIGNVRRVRKDGSGMPETLYAGNGAVSGLALDDTAIYFGLRDVGNVMKLAK